LAAKYGLVYKSSSFPAFLSRKEEPLTFLKKKSKTKEFVFVVEMRIGIKSKFFCLLFF